MARRHRHVARRHDRTDGPRLARTSTRAAGHPTRDAESPGRRALAALERLPEGERAVMELIAVDQLTVTEAAAALGIRQVTARVRLHRARKSLRTESLRTDAEPPTPGARGTSLSYVNGGTEGEA